MVHEPLEMLIVDCPETFMGVVIEKLGPRKGKIKKMVKNNPNMALFVLNMLPEQYRDWVDQQEEILRKLLKK